MKPHRLAITILAVTQVAPPVVAFQIAPVRNLNLSPSSPRPLTSLYGKLWDKLQIEPDTMEDEPGWYVMNCVAGSELDLLAQAKYVTRDIPPELVEKCVVPIERKLRSHGKTQKVVETKVSYPGYCFVKMRCCAETYEPLQQLPLCRSWMAGTVNQKGYKKLPPAPICLSDEEVAKFQGLEEETDRIHKKFGEGYTGRGDRGEDLLSQYEGYEVDTMVKVLSGNFKGEDGVVKRLKDGQIMVRMFTYGNTMDQWFNPDEIRTMTDAEAMRGLGGPTVPVNQDQFDISIGKKPRRRENDRNLRGDLMNSMAGGGQRMRKQDRINRGERSSKDKFGRTEQEMEEEEQNWRQFREDQRAEQQQKRGDMWGIKERTSWDAGDSAASFDEGGKWKSGREKRREQNKRGGGSKDLEDSLSGDGNWDLFTSDAQKGSGSGEEDDFFNSLMTELSDTLDSPSSSEQPKVKGTPVSENSGKEDDFFSSLMSELSDDVNDDKGSQRAAKPRQAASKSYEEDDFFASLEADLQDSLGEENNKGSTATNSEEDDFFASLEADLSDSLGEEPSSKSPDDDFFSNLENELSSTLTEDHKSRDDSGEDDFFSSLQEDLSNQMSEKPKVSSSGGGQDLTKLKVADLKVMLKERGLKVSGKKSELIERLQQS